VNQKVVIQVWHTHVINCIVERLQTYIDVYLPLVFFFSFLSYNCTFRDETTVVSRTAVDVCFEETLAIFSRQ